MKTRKWFCIVTVVMACALGGSCNQDSDGQEELALSALSVALAGRTGTGETNQLTGSLSGGSLPYDHDGYILRYVVSVARGTTPTVVVLQSGQQLQQDLVPGAYTMEVKVYRGSALKYQTAGSVAFTIEAGRITTLTVQLVWATGQLDVQILLPGTDVTGQYIRNADFELVNGSGQPTFWTEIEKADTYGVGDSMVSSTLNGAPSRAGRLRYGLGSVPQRSALQQAVSIPVYSGGRSLELQMQAAVLANGQIDQWGYFMYPLRIYATVTASTGTFVMGIVVINNPAAADGAVLTLDAGSVSMRKTVVTGASTKITLRVGELLRQYFGGPGDARVGSIRLSANDNDPAYQAIVDNVMVVYR